MRWGFFSAICQIVAVFAGLPFGLIGVAAACTIAIYMLFVPALVYAGRPVGIGAKDVIAAVGPQTAAGLITIAVGLGAEHLFLTDFSGLARFFISSMICLSTYLAVAVIAFRVTGPLQLALSILRDFAPMRLPRSS
jgi:PST family polysaccharide transporter